MMDQSIKPGTPLALCTLLLMSLTFIYLLSGENHSVSISAMTRKVHHSKHSLAIVILIQLTYMNSVYEELLAKLANVKCFINTIHIAGLTSGSPVIKTRSKSLLETMKSSLNQLNIRETSMHRDELEAALEGASMPNKTVIITIVNRAYTEGDKPMLDLFLDGFWLGEDTRQLANHLLIVAVDQTAFERCIFLKLHCYKLKTEGEDLVDEKMYMSKDFISMMWQRTRFLGDVLRRGYNFVFTDTDVLWLRNPLPRLTLNESVDLQISVDQFNGNQWSQRNMINTGFYMINSNNKTIALFDKWYEQRNNSTGKKEQDVLVELMHKRVFKRLGLRVRFLDTNYFSGFCRDSRDVNVVSTVHANCCRSIRAKVTDLITVIHDWKRYKDPSRNKTMEYRWSNHLACQSSWI